MSNYIPNKPMDVIINAHLNVDLTVTHMTTSRVLRLTLGGVYCSLEMVS